MPDCCNCGTLCTTITECGKNVPASGTVDILPEGTGPTGTDCAVNGTVAGYNAGGGGSGYTGSPNVAVSGGSPTRAAVITATASGGVVSSYTIVDGGAGYGTVVPTLTVDPPPPSAPATATATIAGGVVTGFTLLGGGSGYVGSSAVVALTGGGFATAATATATVLNGVVTGINLTNAGGSGYTSAPGVSVAAPPALATAKVAAVVTSSCCQAINRSGKYLITATIDGADAKRQVSTITCTGGPVAVTVDVAPSAASGFACCNNIKASTAPLTVTDENGAWTLNWFGGGWRGCGHKTMSVPTHAVPGCAITMTSQTVNYMIRVTCGGAGQNGVLSVNWRTTSDEVSCDGTHNSHWFVSGSTCDATTGVVGIPAGDSACNCSNGAGGSGTSIVDLSATPINSTISGLTGVQDGGGHTGTQIQAVFGPFTVTQ